MDGEAKRDWRPFAVVTAVFVLSRVAYYVAGVRYDASSIDYAIQLLDREVLQKHLLESVWYLHVQPPGFNLLVGLVLRWSPTDETTGLHVVYMVFGLAMTIGLYDLGRQLGIGRWVAVCVAIVGGCGPVAVLYENWPNYDYIVAAILVLLVDACVRWVRSGSLGALSAVVALSAAATLTRSVMHPVWFFAVVCFVLLARRPNPWMWKPVAVIAVGTIAVAGTMLKNEILFGSPQLSSLFGLNLYRATVGQFPQTTIDRLRRDGTLTAPADARPCAIGHPGVPALAEQYKRGPQRGLLTGRERRIPNYNWECYPAYFGELTSDAIAGIRARPGVVAHSVAESFELWAEPASLFPAVFENRQHISGFDDVYRRVVMLDVTWDPPVLIRNAWFIQVAAPDRRWHLSLTVVLATALSVGAGLVALVRARRDGLSARRVGMIIGGGTVAFVTLTGNLFEHGENARFRVPVEPLTLVLATAAIVAVVRAVSAGRATRGRATHDPAGDLTDEAPGPEGPRRDAIGRSLS